MVVLAGYPGSMFGEHGNKGWFYGQPEIPAKTEMCQRHDKSSGSGFMTFV